MKHIILPATVLFLLFASLVQAETTFKSLLVSIEKYELAPLDYAENDIMRLATLLMTRYDGDAQACIDTAANAEETEENAAQKSVMRKIENWCKKLDENDTALLYLAGHGVKDLDGNLYLAMINFNGKNFDAAAIPLQWIRERFESCRGKNKLLLIDTCFAGVGKSIGFASQATSGEVSGAFADLSNVATIASCRADEKSWIWMTMKHSLFTYWLIEAFKGHADLNGDRELTFDELNRYLETNVPWAAEIAIEKPQHPTVHNAGAGKDFKLPLRAIDLTQLIDDIAEQIDLQMRLEKFSQIGVPVFTSGQDKVFDPRYGSLPSWTSNRLREMLAKKSRLNRSGYKVVSENAIREALASKGITSEDLGTEKTKDLKAGGVEIPLLVDGQMTFFGKLGVSLRASLLDTKGKSEVGQSGGAAMLSVTEIGMTDVSGRLDANPPPPNRNTVDNEPGVGLVSSQRVEEAVRLRKEENKPHPTLDPGIPFRIWFEVRTADRENAPYQRREVRYDKTKCNCYLPLSKGEEFRIMIENNTKDGNGKTELVFARILVDGLNTLSQAETMQVKGAHVEEAPKPEHVVAPRASLNEARPWAMNLKGPFSIPGYFNVRGKVLNRFEIVDADQSIAAHKKYTEQLGMITIAFFRAATPKQRGGVGLGRIQGAQLRQFQGAQIPGEMMVVYNIRYATPEKIGELIEK